MRLSLALIAAAVLPAAAVAAPAATVRSAAPPCFYSEDVTGFRVPTDRTVYIATSRGETWRLDTITDCNRARSAQSVGFRTLAGDRVCQGGDVQLVVPGAVGTCPVSRITRLTEPEAAALSANERP